MWHVFGKDTSISLREHIKVSLWTTRHFLRWYKLWQVIGQRNPVLELSGCKFLSGIYYLQLLITNNTYCAWYMYNIQCVNKHQSFLLFLIIIFTGINYLHNEAPVKVIHRDLKSKNGKYFKIFDLAQSTALWTRLKKQWVGTEIPVNWDWCQWIMKAWNCNTTIKLDYLKFYTKVKYFKVI